MASIAKTLREAVARLGPFGTLTLLARKLQKRQRYKLMLREVSRVETTATLVRTSTSPIEIDHADKTRIVEAADRMLADDNRFFTFAYHLRSVDRPWEFDPIEGRHWPRRHYTEQRLHGEDTPSDVKIVWEINRFADLPALAEAAYLTRDARYAEQIESRLLSWIAENPFAHSINWASALEIAIRVISWTFSLDLLRQSGFAVHENERIRRSVYEQLRYLSADLSLDKVVPTNHLIGEVAGLFIGANLWDYPTGGLDQQTARRLLESEIIRQTFEDGVTREASSWYHQFVTGFFDLAARVAIEAVKPMSSEYHGRLAKMKAYVRALTLDREIVRYGDADDGWPLKITGPQDAWLAGVFGPALQSTTYSDGFFTESRQAALRVQDSFVFLRAGEFGMGGAGFSSHAHDDFLSPIVYIDGLPVLTDPGTYVYNGAAEERRKYRGADAHNGLVIGDATGAMQRMNFGWHLVRPRAQLDVVARSSDRVTLEGSYHEWPWHRRVLTLEKDRATVTDKFERGGEGIANWRFHFDPRWKPVHQSDPEYHFEDAMGNRLEVRLTGSFEWSKLEHYDYSPSYRVKEQAFELQLRGPVQQGDFSVNFHVSRRSA